MLKPKRISQSICASILKATTWQFYDMWLRWGQMDWQTFFVTFVNLPDSNIALFKRLECFQWCDNRAWIGFVFSSKWNTVRVFNSAEVYDFKSNAFNAFAITFSLKFNRLKKGWFHTLLHIFFAIPYSQKMMAWKTQECLVLKIIIRHLFCQPKNPCKNIMRKKTSAWLIILALAISQGLPEQRWAPVSTQWICWM